MSLKIKIYNKKAEEVKEMELDSDIFSQEVNEELLHQVVVAQSANSRQVIAHSKGRADVAGGGKKPWQQKGTGRARAGSSRSPIWRGGGVTFGPSNDRNFKKKINTKMKRKAISMVLSDKLAGEKMVVLENLKFDEFKTKDFVGMLESIEKNVLKNDRRNTLIINSEKDKKTYFSGRNLTGIKIINAENINILDILNHKNLIVDEALITSLSEKYKK
ncbi:MAG: 50S ribosomal protein L4 [Patescibacteria group bacterium]|jgi:large subunit ribosomal protein L4|nr:50S ribosomal protein L4 [Patescibacteria group bacterium]